MQKHIYGKLYVYIFLKQLAKSECINYWNITLPTILILPAELLQVPQDPVQVHGLKLKAGVCRNKLFNGMKTVISCLRLATIFKLHTKTLKIIFSNHLTNNYFSLDAVFFSFTLFCSVHSRLSKVLLSCLNEVSERIKI